MRYKYIDKIVRNKILDKNAKLNSLWNSIEPKLDTSKRVYFSASKSFFASSFFKIFSAFIISSAILVSFIFINNTDKKTDIISAQKISVKISSVRRVSQKNHVAKKKILSSYKNKIRKKKILPKEHTHSTTVVNIEKTDIDTVRIK